MPESGNVEGGRKKPGVSSAGAWPRCENNGPVARARSDHPVGTGVGSRYVTGKGLCGLRWVGPREAGTFSVSEEARGSYIVRSDADKIDASAASPISDFSWVQRVENGKCVRIRTGMPRPGKLTQHLAAVCRTQTPKCVRSFSD